MFSKSKALRVVTLLLFATTILFGNAYAKGAGGKSSPKGDVSVNGYVKGNGTYVAPYMRSAPDSSFTNNWSTYGNVNPYTGTEGTKLTPNTAGQSPLYLPPATLTPDATTQFQQLSLPLRPICRPLLMP